MARNVLLMEFGLWVIIELPIVALALVAARRHKSTGLYFLAAAVILATIDDTLHAVWSTQFLATHGNITVYLAILGYGHYAVTITALCGWGILAFARKKTDKPNA